MSPSRKYEDFDEEVAILVMDLHKKHPNLGHHGLMKALKDEGYEVDPQHLELFMKDAHIEGERLVLETQQYSRLLETPGPRAGGPAESGQRVCQLRP